jgi:hypothetical protein
MFFVPFILPKPVIMKKSLLISLVMLFILSCEKKENVVPCNTAVENLQWMNELKASFTNCTCQISVFQAVYLKQTVFYWLMNDPLCDGVQKIYLYDCSGNIVKHYPIPDQTFTDAVTDRKVIFTCKTKK